MSTGDSPLTLFLRRVSDRQAREGFDKLMFGWVHCGRKIMPGLSIERLLEAFAREFAIPPDQFNIESQRVRYNRMQREFFSIQKAANNHAEGKP